MIVGAIVHIVVVAIVFLAGAYLVFVSAQKADGLLKPVGVVLAALLAAIAALIVIAYLTSPMFGGRPFGMHMWGQAAPAPATSAPSASPSAAGGGKPSASETGGEAGGGESAGKP
jgi:hypothetical protein